MDDYIIFNWLEKKAARVHFYKATQGDENSTDTIAIQSNSDEFSYCLHLSKQQAIDLAAALVTFATQDKAEEVTA